jgi:hypothetical protein
LDPVLDFQLLLSMEDVGERLQFFAKMLSRERSRMELLAKFGGNRRKNKKDEDLEPPKGAWFDDDMW